DHAARHRRIDRNPRRRRSSSRPLLGYAPRARRAGGRCLKLRAAGEPHLTYCTNIHAGESWAEVKSAVDEHVTAVKRAVTRDAAFGVGLRLSARAAAELSDPEELLRFRATLDARNMYVFTINGFPYGAFHGTRVKEQVYLPDWLDDARLSYTALLGDLLAQLL